MDKRRTTEEIEDALLELVLMRPSHYSDDPALEAIDECLAESEPMDQAQLRQQLQALFRRLWSDGPPVVVKVMVIGKERAR